MVVRVLMRSKPGSSHQRFISLFDLQAICKKSDDKDTGKAEHKFFLAERHVRLDMESAWTPPLFLFEGWLVFRLQNELVWYDKEGQRSETRTELDSNSWIRIFASGSSLILRKRDGKLLLKR